MELNLYNRTKRKGVVGQYKEIFQQIMKKTADVLDLSDDICASVIFVLDKKMHQINKEYRDVDRTTDVISFALADYQEDENDYVSSELGDIFINLDAVDRQAETYQHSVRRECCFLFTHGLLHLNGYDHQNKEDEKEMIEMQKKILDDIIPQNDL